jgi:EAL domain-containing protein (putative c-di-GMP-specific phosphodiesterase class I)
MTTMLSDAALAGADLHSVYQPIVDLASRRTIGYEALARFSDVTPDVAFAEAARCGRLVELEMQALGAALEGLDRLPKDAFLSVNVSPATITQSAFKVLLAELDAERVVVEIVETTPVDHYDELLDVLAPYRRRGLRMAIDDLGSGFAGLAHLMRLRPDVVKLDRELISGVEARPVDQALAGTVARYAERTGAMVIGEGIEQEEEALCLQLVGVTAGQGWLFGRPAEAPAAA